jgi:succinate dehydrogenase / fumarate reductase cytochrome b subunit
MQYTDDKSNRPLSPHLGIYKPQISSTLSIMHRVSGIINFLGLLTFVWWLVAVTFSTKSPMDGWVWNFFSSSWGLIILIAWSFSVFFHFCTGTRHLFWDAGLGFDIKVMKITGWVAVVMAFFLTGLTWLIILSVI